MSNVATALSFMKLKIKSCAFAEITIKLIQTLICPSIDYCCDVYYEYLTQANKNKFQDILNA